ncbi:MAG: hypothetical protein QOJ57_41 [Thermoleophilaceae bacterium]|nr:hypothetical protein [Thermoleophilaceae bacterium]
MAALTAEAVLRLADAGPRLPGPERALLAIAAAEPERPWEELRALTVGECDRRLVLLHEEMFGAELEGFAECPRCGEAVEVRIAAAELLEETGSPQEKEPATARGEGLTVTFRLPTAGDLADVAARAADVESARAAILDLCVLEVSGGARPSELPQPLVDEVARRMAERDPAAEVELALACPACDHRWTVVLDAGTFLWRKLDALAGRLAEEVDALARAYGWSEREILALPSARRSRYLELVGG